MDSELENKPQGQPSEQNGESQELAAANYQKDYRSGNRPQRPRIRVQRAYSTSRTSSDEGGFRPEGFGAGLLQNNNNSSYQPRQQSGYRPRFNSGDNAQGGYQPRQGGYQQRGARPQRGGYNKNYQQGGYRQRTADYDPNAKYSMKKRIEYSETHIDPNEPIRLNKYLANAGVCSRREADEYIEAGAVTVNGTVVTSSVQRLSAAMKSSSRITWLHLRRRFTCFSTNRRIV